MFINRRKIYHVWGLLVREGLICLTIHTRMHYTHVCPLSSLPWQPEYCLRKDLKTSRHLKRPNVTSQGRGWLGKSELCSEGRHLQNWINALISEPCCFCPLVRWIVCAMYLALASLLSTWSSRCGLASLCLCCQMTTSLWPGLSTLLHLVGYALMTPPYLLTDPQQAGITPESLEEMSFLTRDSPVSI